MNWTIFPCLLLAAFWAGALLLFFALRKPRFGLKERAQGIYRAARRKLAASAGSSGLERYARRERMERDLAEALAYLKNIVILGRGSRMSAELMLEELASLGGSLSQVFENMAHSLHVNDKEAAAQALPAVFADGRAADVGRFLAGWEDVPPAELSDTVEIYRAALREEQATRRERQDELISDLIYFPVVMDCMLVLLNFIFVAFFINQREALQLLY